MSQDPEALVRLSVTFSAVKLGDEATKLLVQLAQDDALIVGYGAFDQLEAIGSSALPQLEALAKSGNPHVAQRAARATEKIKSKAST